MDHDRNPVSRTRRLPPKAAALLAMVAAGVGGGCDRLPALPELPAMPDLSGLPGVYRIDVQQGNIVDREMLDRIEIGMERRKVRFILGTPLLVDSFNQDRWDYVYSLRRGSGEEVGQRVAVYFVDDRVARIDDRLEPGVVEGSAAERAQTLVKVPKRRPREGLLDRLTPDFLVRDDDPAGDDTPGDASGGDDAGVNDTGGGTQPAAE